MTLSYLVVADYACLSIDGKVSINGIFHSVACVKFPTSQQCYVVAQVLGGRTEVGEHQLGVLIQDNGAVALATTFTFELPEPPAGHFDVGFTGVLRAALSLARPGKYRAHVSIDGRDYPSDTYLSVLQREPAEVKAE